MADRLKMKKVLFDLATEEEKEEFAGLELAELNDSIARLEESVAGGAKSDEVLKMIHALGKGFDRLKNVQSQQSQITAEAFKELQTELLKGLKGLEGVLVASKSKKGDKFYDDFSTNLIQLTGYSKRTSELISNLKWNTWMGVKDSNGTPINPSIAGFNLSDPYDYIAITYSGSNPTVVKYYNGGATGQLVGTLTLAYSGNNITSVTRT